MQLASASANANAEKKKERNGIQCRGKVCSITIDLGAPRGIALSTFCYAYYSIMYAKIDMWRINITSMRELQLNFFPHFKILCSWSGQYCTLIM